MTIPPITPTRWLRTNWDRAAAAAGITLGIVLLVIGWQGVSTTEYVAEQLPYLASAGLGGLFLLGAAATLWLSADLRDEWHKLDRVERAVNRLADAEERRSTAEATLEAVVELPPVRQRSPRRATSTQTRT